MKIEKVLAMFLAVVMVLLTLQGCGNTDSESLEIGTGEEKVSDEELPASFQGLDNVSYVLIYNPDIYDENSSINYKLATGSLEDEIDVSAVKADTLDSSKELPFKPISQADINNDLDMGEMGENLGNRAGGIVPQYAVGDTHDFYHQASMLEGVRVSDTFLCRYAGEHGNIWTMEDDETITDEWVNYYGQQFDEVIYDKDVELFGEPRYADEGGKVNLLFYECDPQLLGFFTMKDIFATGEVTNDVAENYQLNLDHAILNVNSLYTGIEDFSEMVCSTMGHELQHLICATDSFYTSQFDVCHTWINEAMSGYVEEQLFPGVKETENHYNAFVTSDRIRHGQSIYNFDTDSSDIGVYGSVYLFSEFLAELGGPNVYHDFHDFWRTSNGNKVTDAETLYSILPVEEINRIQNKWKLPDDLNLDSEYEVFLSQLVLEFYVSLLENGADLPGAYDHILSQTLLYDELNSTEIEGGGRVVVATKEGTFEIPEDSEDGLVYIGFDASFNPVTTVIE